MSPWRCVLCHENVPAEEIVSGQHMRLFHPDEELPERWPDGELVVFDSTVEEEFML